ncbi:unnamed protein product [Angiostrongylus costaricensis]|uniref:Ku domain-containing protein n=1 Tax=Angiostrongylus costaricensis TaxID=334426 RepID=A0A158PLE3_ANGCS|nr:unnamed protein product [Angiostrongylus costaricensis]
MSNCEFDEQQPSTAKAQKKTARKEKHGVLVLVIDCGSTMNNVVDGRSYFSVAKEAADWLLSRKILTNPSTECGYRDADVSDLITQINALEVNLIAVGIDDNFSCGHDGRIPVPLEIVKRTDGISFSFNPMVDSRAIRKSWEIAPGVRLPLTMYTKTAVAKNPFKSVFVNEDGIEMHRESRLQTRLRNDDTMNASNSANLTRINFEKQRLYVYYFGDTKVPIGEEDEAQYNCHNFNEGEQRGCMKLIQFAKKDYIKECYFMGHNSFVAVPGWEKKTSERDLRAMRITLSLINAMLENDVIAICRYAPDAAKHLQLMALMPHKDEKFGLVYLKAFRLPFAEDMRPFNFVNVCASCPKPSRADENGFNLQEVVKVKRRRQEIRQENISEWLAELEGAEEESKVKVKNPQIRFIDRARVRLNDNFDFHMASLLDEVSVLMTGAEDEESNLLYGIALARLLSLRSLAIEFGRHAEFNEWLRSSKNRWPEWALFCSSMENPATLISNSECPSSEYSDNEATSICVADELNVPSLSLSEGLDTVCLKQILQEVGIENSSKCLSPTFERNAMGICEKVYEAAKQRAIDKEYVQSITEQEILAFSYQLQRETKGTTEESRVTIAKLYQFLSQSPQAVRECFSSAVINKLVMHSNNQDGCISSQILIDFLHTCCRRLQQRLLLQSVAKSIEYISSNEFIDFLMTEISNKIVWEGMKDYPFYYAVFVERCVFFHLDPQRAGKDLTFTILLDDIFEILVDQKRCDEEYEGNAVTSWCSLNNFWRVLQQFRHCDNSWSGMVSLEECRSIRDGALTPLFLERIFATQTLYGERSCQEMDFRGFVELDIAFRTRNAESMLTNLLLLEGGSDCVADDIVDEIFDMVNPKIQDRISLKDMLDSHMAETALGILIDYPSFLKYEKKEEETGS